MRLNSNPETGITRYLFLITTLEGVASLLFLLSLPKSAGSYQYLGYSPSRLALILGLFLATLVLIWLTINIWRKPEWEQKISALPGALAARSHWLPLVLTTLSAGFIAEVFLLFFWAFTLDAYYLGYLLRFGPVLIFGTLVNLQILIALLWQLQAGPRSVWLWSLLFIGVLVLIQEWPLIAFHKLNNVLLLPIIFVDTLYAQALFRRSFQVPPKGRFAWLIAIISVSMFILIELLLIPRKFQVYRQSFFVFSPMILTAMVACTDLVDKVLSAMNRNGWSRILMFLIILAGFVYVGDLYYHAGSDHAKEVNTTYKPYDDELAYMRFTITAYEMNFQYTGTRNQMPVYPYIQALFYKPGMSMDDLFVQGKQVNIVLSLAALAVMFLVFKKFLPLPYVVNLTLITAFGLYVFKSGYFMSELLYYSMGALSFLFLGLLLIRPSIKLSIGTGLLLGVAHMTKASALPALLLFIGVFAVKELFTTLIQWKNGLPDAGSGQVGVKLRLASLVLVVIGFLAVTAPYGIESKRIYGSFFYNVNSTFYMWNDSYEESIAGPIAHGDGVGWPDMPAEDIPSPGKYFREHNLSQIWDRLVYGMYWQGENLIYQYGFFNYPVLFLTYGTVLFFIDLKRSLLFLKKYTPIVAFAVCYITGYTILYIWYSPIACLPRFIYALYIPLLLSIFIAAQSLAGEKNLPLIKLTNLAVFVMILIDVWYVVSRGPFFHDFGS